MSHLLWQWASLNVLDTQQLIKFRVVGDSLDSARTIRAGVGTCPWRPQCSPCLCGSISPERLSGCCQTGGVCVCVCARILVLLCRPRPCSVLGLWLCLCVLCPSLFGLGLGAGEQMDVCSVCHPSLGPTRSLSGSWRSSVPASVCIAAHTREPQRLQNYYRWQLRSTSGQLCKNLRKPDINLDITYLD